MIFSTGPNVVKIAGFMLEHSSHVINFYDKFSLGNVSQDLTCCRNRVIDVDSDEQDDNDNDIKT
jgi:hypothetical protein